MHAIAIPPLRLVAAPELAGCPALALASTCGLALLVGEAAAGKVGNRAMRIAARSDLPAIRQRKSWAMRQCGSVARRRFVWCQPPCDGICWQLGNADCRKLAVASNAAIEGGLCIPSPYSARKAAPGNPP